MHLAPNSPWASPPAPPIHPKVYLNTQNHTRNYLALMLGAPGAASSACSASPKDYFTAPSAHGSTPAHSSAATGHTPTPRPSRSSTVAQTTPTYPSTKHVTVSLTPSPTLLPTISPRTAPPLTQTWSRTGHAFIYTPPPYHQFLHLPHQRPSPPTLRTSRSTNDATFADTLSSRLISPALSTRYPPSMISS